MLVGNVFQNFLFYTGLAGNKARRDNDCALAIGLDGVNHMLNKAGVNGHLGFVGVNLLYLVGDTGPKADTVCRQGVGILREVQLERRITYHEVKLLEASILFYMGGFQKGVPLHHIRQAAHQVVQNQI